MVFVRSKVAGLSDNFQMSSISDNASCSNCKMDADLVKMMGNLDAKSSRQQRHHQRAKKNTNYRSKSVSHIDDGPEPDWSEFEKTYASELVPASDEDKKTEHFLKQLVDVLVEYIRKNVDRGQKVVDFHHPHQLREILDHCLDIPDEPQPLEQILSDCKETLKYGVKSGHPRFFNQLSSGLDVVSMAADWLTATTNTNMFTYEVAPVFTLMEDVVLNKMRQLIGWEDGDGIFSPGGAMSNLYAVHVARQRHLPVVKQRGLHGGPRLVIFTSEHSHFSFKKAGVVLGLGSDNVVSVKTDEWGKMIVANLEEKICEAIKEDAQPFFVNATACTTVYGAIDPLTEVADVCEKYGLWLHVDAAWGGGLLMSRRQRHKLDGIERADSVTWNPHKMMGATLQCSAILLRHQGMLADANSMSANYLFQQDKNYDVKYDTGDKAIQCGRHNDVFKLWLMWRAKGDKGMEYQINHIFDMARYLVQKVAPRADFLLLLDEPESTNVCFWYLPPKIRQMQPGKKRDEELNKVAPQIKAMMMEKGGTMVGYQPIGDKPNFFRMVVTNPAVKKEDIDYLIEEIVRIGNEL